MRDLVGRKLGAGGKGEAGQIVERGDVLGSRDTGCVELLAVKCVCRQHLAQQGVQTLELVLGQRVAAETFAVVHSE